MDASARHARLTFWRRAGSRQRRMVRAANTLSFPMLGLLDTEDCLNAAVHSAAAGLVYMGAAAHMVDQHRPVACPSRSLDPMPLPLATGAPLLGPLRPLCPQPIAASCPQSRASAGGAAASTFACRQTLGRSATVGGLSGAWRGAWLALACPAAAWSFPAQLASLHPLLDCPPP